jgi:hypothetical protein
MRPLRLKPGQWSSRGSSLASNHMPRHTRPVLFLSKAEPPSAACRRGESAGFRIGGTIDADSLAGGGQCKINVLTKNAWVRIIPAGQIL